MIRNSMLPTLALAICTAAALLSGCTTPQGARPDSARNGQEQSVDPKTGIALPGQGGGAGAGGGY